MHIIKVISYLNQIANLCDRQKYWDIKSLTTLSNRNYYLTNSHNSLLQVYTIHEKLSYLDITMWKIKLTGLRIKHNYLHVIKNFLLELIILYSGLFFWPHCHVILLIIKGF